MTNKRYKVPSYIEKEIQVKTHLYSDFYRYSSMEKGKFKPKLDGNRIKDKPVPSQLVEYRKKLIQSCADVIALEYKAEKLIISGVPSPYSGDAITALHSIYGIPYIEGSSIKGLLKNCIVQEEDQAINQEWFKLAFGVSSEEADDKCGQGNLVFFDSFPENKFTLEKDIQAPHYGEYYREEGKVAPTDDLSPNLFNFYVVKDTTFTIIVGVLEKSKNAVSTIKKNLEIALMDYGVGGKTAVGYGLAAEVNDVSEKFQRHLKQIQQKKEQKKRQEQKQREQERFAQLTPIEQLHEQLDQLTESVQDMERSKQEIYEGILQYAAEDKTLAQKLLRYWKTYDLAKPSKKQKIKLDKVKQFL